MSNSNCPDCGMPLRLMGSGERYVCDNRHYFRVCETCGGEGTVLAQEHYPTQKQIPLTCLRCRGTGRAIDGAPCACGAVTLPYFSAIFAHDNTVHKSDKCEAYGA